MVGGVGGHLGVVAEERLVGCGVLLVGDVGDGLVGQIGAEVVAVVAVGRRLDVVLVAHQIGGPAVGPAVEHPVVALEAHPGGPQGERTGGAALAPGSEVPLADGHGAPAGVPQDAGQHGGRRGDAGGVAGKPHGHVGQKPHAHRVVVAPGQKGGPGGRAQGGHVEAVVRQSARGQPVDVGGGDVGPEAAKLGEPGVVQQDDQHVGRPLGGSGQLGRPRGGLGHGKPDAG